MVAGRLVDSSRCLKASGAWHVVTFTTWYWLKPVRGQHRFRELGSRLHTMGRAVKSLHKGCGRMVAMVVLLQVTSDPVRNSMALAARGRLDSGSSLLASGKLLSAMPPCPDGQRSPLQMGSVPLSRCAVPPCPDGQLPPLQLSSAPLSSWAGLQRGSNEAMWERSQLWGPNVCSSIY